VKEKDRSKHCKCKRRIKAKLLMQEKGKNEKGQSKNCQSRRRVKANLSMQEKGQSKIVNPGEGSKQKLSIQEKTQSKNCQSRRVKAKIKL